MKKVIIVVFISCVIGAMFSSCKKKDVESPQTPIVKTSFWKLTDKEILWMYKISTTIPGNVAYSPWEKISPFPYGTTYTLEFYNDTYRYALIGSEYDLTVTDSSYALTNKWTTNFSWDSFPVNMKADTLYQIAAETKGDGGNMMLISNSYNYPGTTNDWILYAYRNAGETFAKVKIDKPIDITLPGKKAIRVSIASAYALIEYAYIYEWVTDNYSDN